jgi:hypothetical protein
MRTLMAGVAVTFIEVVAYSAASASGFGFWNGDGFHRLTRSRSPRR